MSANYKHFSIEHREGVTIATLINFELLDRLITDELQEELVTLVESEKPQMLIISYTQVRRCSTEVINAMLKCRRRTLDYDGKFKLCGMSKDIRGVYRILKLDGTVFEIHDTVADAWSAF